jgi:integration host factor subunit beta
LDEHDDLELEHEDDGHEGEEDTAAGVMTKAELVDEVARVVQLTKKQAEMIVNIVFDSIVDSLRSGQKIELRGFGSFRLRSRKSRTGRNPKTGEKVEVPSKKIPYFKPGKELKELINKAMAEAEAAETAEAAHASE